jgi:hypothetical protein
MWIINKYIKLILNIYYHKVWILRLLVFVSGKELGSNILFVEEMVVVD